MRKIQVNTGKYNIIYSLSAFVKQTFNTHILKIHAPHHTKPFLLEAFFHNS